MEIKTYLTFVLDQELFAVNVVNVLEVLEQKQITKVPNGPEHILGIINFRGEIIPVVNLREKFHQNSSSNSTKNCIIVFEIGESENRFTTAALGDGVKDVIEIDNNDIQPVPEMGLSYDSRFISGIIKRNSDFILILNPEKVFAISLKDVVNQLEVINQ